MRIARPLLLVSTPIGMVAGLREAARFHWWLAVLMAALMGVIALCLYFTLRVARRERQTGRR